MSVTKNDNLKLIENAYMRMQPTRRIIKNNLYIPIHDQFKDDANLIHGHEGYSKNLLPSTSIGTQFKLHLKSTLGIFCISNISHQDILPLFLLENLKTLST